MAESENRKRDVIALIREDDNRARRTAARNQDAIS
jgi:hypothetical protein